MISQVTCCSCGILLLKFCTSLVVKVYFEEMLYYIVVHYACHACINSMLCGCCCQDLCGKTLVHILAEEGHTGTLMLVLKSSPSDLAKATDEVTRILCSLQSLQMSVFIWVLCRSFRESIPIHSNNYKSSLDI